MTLLQHEIDYIADRLLDHCTARFDSIIRATIREELRMTDQAILDLTAAVDGVVAELTTLVTDNQTTAAALAAALAAVAAANGAALDPDIAAQTKRLVDGTAAAAAAVAALTPATAAVAAAAATAPAAAPAPAAPAASA